ncbi:MAG: restriction endonuclease subunit S [Acidiferrobacteraceae bacterium]
MVGEWRRHDVSDLLNTGKLVIGDGYRAKNEELASSGLPFARAGNINNGFRFADADRFPEKNITRVGNKISQPGDVVFTSKGTVGRFAFVRPETQRFVYSPQLCFWRSLDRETIDPRFLYYWMYGREFFVQFKGVAGQTDMAEYVSLTDQRRMHITLPEDIEEQRAIAYILGTLDDKIELNWRMNETLEAMARALFKSWFVDFDPVRAKAECRDPGLPRPPACCAAKRSGAAGRLADLFADSFEDSELGEIPKGWKVGRFGDVLCQRVERCAPSAETAARPYVPIDCISPKSLFLTESRPGEEAQSSLTKFYKGDLLFGAMRPYFHKVCIAPFDGTTRTTAFVLYPRLPDDFGFATLMLHHPDTIDFATRHSTGSTIPYAVWAGSLEDMPIVMPPQDIRKAFNRVVQPILVRIPEPYLENRTLAALRDSLLPKLISGELRVNDAERIAAEATA